MKGDVTINHLFSITPSVNIERSAFDRSSTLKTCFNSSYLVPIYCDEVLPGDTFNLKASLFCRMSTPIVPVMDNLFLETFWFFVPNRIVWNNFTKFMGEQEDPDDSIDYVVPNIGSSNYTVAAGSVCDYFGIPVGAFYGNSSGKQRINALPLRGYYLIWNEFFRDENLQDSIKVSKADNTVHNSKVDGVNYPWEANSLLKRNKRFDYFTSCLPTPVKFQSMTLPLAGSAPVYGSGKALALTDGTSKAGLYRNSSGSLKDETAIYGTDVGSTVTPDEPALFSNKALGVVEKGTGVVSGLYADLTDVTAVTVSDLRTAFQIQRLLESQNRSGTRYVEILYGQFHVFSGDARLQRPEFLGSSSCRININPVQQTSSTDSTNKHCAISSG